MTDQVRWLYLDMNSYFASVEQELNPALRGRPVAVVPMMADTTVCIAASYEAKAFGVKTGTLVGDARKLCPGIELVEGDHENYIRYHHLILKTVETVLPIESVRSIDEVACRLTGSQQAVSVAENLARELKRKMRENVGECLQCSIGLGPNRYLAKIAADMKKPDGLTVIRPTDLPRILHTLTLRDLPGVGSKTEKRLLMQGLNTMEKLTALSQPAMRAAWGSIVGDQMWHLLRGDDVTREDLAQKTLSQSHVLPPNLRHPDGAHQVLKKLITKAAVRLRREKLWAKSMEVFVRFSGQGTPKDAWSARATIGETQDTLKFLHTAAELLKEFPAGSPFAVGVVLSGLVSDADHLPTLFDDPKREKLTKTLDAMNEKFGKNAVHFGAVHESLDLAPLRIAFTRIPDPSEID